MTKRSKEYFMIKDAKSYIDNHYQNGFLNCNGVPLYPFPQFVDSAKNVVYGFIIDKNGHIHGDRKPLEFTILEPYKSEPSFNPVITISDYKLTIQG